MAFSSKQENLLKQSGQSSRLHPPWQGRKDWVNAYWTDNVHKSHYNKPNDDMAAKIKGQRENREEEYQ